MINRFLFVALLAAMNIAAAQEKQYLSAKELFYTNATKPKPPHAKKSSYVGKTAAVSYAGLKYQILRKPPNGPEAPVDPDSVFHSGDRIRFVFESSIDGYLYVVQKGSSGRWNVLFPDPRVNQGKNSIQKEQKYDVPAGKWFTFDSTPGNEQIEVFLSRSAMKELPGFERPVMNVQTVTESVVDELNNKVNSRDLVFEKDSNAGQSAAQAPEAVYVVNRQESGQAVVVTITLRHN
jgi:hypothetical protein